MGKRANGEGSIYRRKSDGRWVGSLSLPDGTRKIFYGKKQAEVIAKLDGAAQGQNTQNEVGSFFLNYFLPRTSGRGERI